MAYSSLTVVNMLNQLFLIFILLHYLLNGNVDRKQQICLKSKTWEVKIHSYFTDAHLDLSIDSAVGQTFLAIGINSVRSLFLEWSSSNQVKQVDTNVGLFTYSYKAINWLYKIYFQQHDPQQSDTWGSNLFIVTAESIIAIGISLDLNLLLRNDGYIAEKLRQIDHIITGWNRHENGMFSSFTIVSMVIQALMFCALFRNYSIWWTQTSDENLKTFIYWRINLLLFNFQINVTLVLNTVFIFTNMLIALHLYKNSQGLDLKACIALLALVTVPRITVLSYNYLTYGYTTCSLHGQLHNLHVDLNGVVGGFQIYNRLDEFYLLLLHDLNSIVPDPKRVNILPTSKEAYYLSQQRL